MRDQGIGSWPRRRLKSTADKVAVTFEGRSFTYADVEERSRRLAGALRDAGVERGDRVAYVGFNHPTLLETFFATAQLGAVWVIVNARLAAPEVEFILGDSGAKVVVFGRDHHEHARRLAHLGQVGTWLQVDAGEEVLDLEGADARGYEATLAAAGTDLIDEPVTWDDPAMIMYTSGTTGRPKGATHTHGSLSMQYYNSLVDMDIASSDVTLSMAPLFHVAGLNMLTMPTFLKGGTIVVQAGFDAAAVLSTIESERVTSMFAVPAMMDTLAARPEFAGTDLSSLTTVVCGGSPLPDRMLRTWGERGVQVQQGFGMTETAPGIYLLRAEDALARSGSAGTEHFWTEARIVDPTGRDVGVGEVGEVIAQGPNVMRGYWNRPDATEEVLKDGWYHTGDLGSFDPDRFLTVRDRLKDMYISGGENIYPAEVENALLDLPGVADAAVIGVPDERWGEVGHAYVVAGEGEGGLDPDLVTRELGERLARYKVPKEIVVVDELPRTATGKLQKHIIRNRFED
ncbi:acyl-CoA synthetase [Georgenia sp. Z1491]|uniref:acyl-CoA synthetase n=1 Tax=Georgenia sp. Z1491 TaxID=3416707 RepID=UPI003CEBD97A